MEEYRKYCLLFRVEALKPGVMLWLMWHLRNRISGLFYKGEDYVLEDFPPASYQAGDDIVAYVDNTGSFKVFSDGETTQITSFPPDFYQVRNKLIIYGEQGYFKVWYDNNPYFA